MDRIGPKNPTRLYIRERMAKVPIDNERLSERMECSPGTVSKLLNGNMQMTAQWLERFAHALDVTVPQLFIDPDRPSADELLAAASDKTRERIFAVIETMLKTGT